MVKKIRKRDGSVVFFQKDKIEGAIWKAVRAVGGENKERAMELTDLIVEKLSRMHGEHGIPEVEEVQDITEKVLIEDGHAKVAKAFILYRKSREELRNVKGLFDTIEAVEDYIGLNDWMVKENSNMGYSLQGLNNYIATKIIANYWVRRIYPEAVRKVHEAGDLHVHDLGCLGAYCVGWDLKDLLMVGFKGVKGKVESKPPKHLRTALGQMINFFYTLQGETAGAQAFSNFDTLLAPFVRYDNLDYKQVRQIMQEFVFNLAVPTRVGFQCMSEDTEILTPNGWAGHDDLKKGDIIKTFNIKKGTIENKPIKKLFARKYNGMMYNLKNRIQDQLISPGHRVVYKPKNSSHYLLDTIEKIKDKEFFIPASLTDNIKNFGDFCESKISRVKKVKYNGVIWCPNTDNETVIARRNGKVFITGNTPFTNITMDLDVPNYMANEHVIVGGQPQIETYGDFQKEMNMVNKAFAECMLEGDATGQVFTFPIPTYNITKDFNFDNPDYDLIWEMTAKYGIPYFSNFVNSDMKPEDARSMCCRLKIDNRELRKRGGGLFGANPQTGSVGVVTINMARLGYVSTSEDDFMARLNRLMELAKESLEIKRKTIENFTEMGLYPYTKFYLRQVHQRFGEYWKNHFATIGLLGMNESVVNFLPGENITTEKGRTFALKILDFMREKLAEYQDETGNIYNLEATPGEGTTYRFARMDKKRFGRILVANEDAYQNGAKPYYTNSSQLPVNFTDDVFEALDLQDELQCKYTGGCVFHTFVGERMTKDSVKKMVKKISDNYHLPYFTISPTFSVCPIHGYLSGEHEYCPKCDIEIEQAKTHVVAEDVVAAEISNEKIVEAEEIKVELPKAVLAPRIIVEGDSITVVDGADSDSELNFGGDTNGEDKMRSVE